MARKQDTPDSESIQRGYDVREVNIRGLGWFVVGFVLTGVLLGVAVWWLVGYLARADLAAQPPVSPLQETAVVAPEPRLQPSPGQPEVPWQDLLRLRVAEERVLTTYGWVDRPGGIARIPVDRAAELALQQRLFPQTQPASQEADHAPR